MIAQLNLLLTMDRGGTCYGSGGVMSENMMTLCRPFRIVGMPCFDLVQNDKMEAKADCHDISLPRDDCIAFKRSTTHETPYRMTDCGRARHQTNKQVYKNGN